MEKYIEAQDNGDGFGNTYKNAIEELKKGEKISHWIWYCLPTIYGLGVSDMSKKYAIKNDNEAIKYLQHNILGKRLLDMLNIIMRQILKNNITINNLMGSEIDVKKLISSLTLWKYIIMKYQLGGRNIDDINKIVNILLKKYGEDNVTKEKIMRTNNIMELICEYIDKK